MTFSKSAVAGIDPVDPAARGASTGEATRVLGEWLAGVIRDNPELYTQGTVLPSDFKILILNGQHVLSATRSDIPVTPGVKLDGKWWSPELILETANRGSEVSVVHLHDYLSGDFERANPEFIAAYDQAETKVEINLSLPVRNALDAICSIRMGVAGHIGKRS